MRSNTLLAAITVFIFALNCKVSGGEEVVPGEIHYLKVAIPSELKMLHMQNPYAKLVVRIDRKGELTEQFCIWATHYELVQYAKRKVESANWVFPESIEDQSEISIEVHVHFIDYEQVAWKSSNGNFTPMGSSGLDGTKARIYRSAPDLFLFQESNPNEIDHPLKVVEGALVIVKGKDGELAKGKVVVEYYVDHEGTVRFPNVISSSNPFATESALKTLEKLKFNKPSKNGNPTYVKVRQPFNFG